MGKLFLIFIGFHRQCQPKTKQPKPKTTVHFIMYDLYNRLIFYISEFQLSFFVLFCFIVLLLVWWFVKDFTNCFFMFKDISILFSFWFSFFVVVWFYTTSVLGRWKRKFLAEFSQAKKLICRRLLRFRLLRNALLDYEHIS